MRGTRWSRRGPRRSPLGAIATLAAIALIAGLAALVFAPPATLVGQARAIDGDSLAIGETRIRLLGLDAVEYAQTCTREGEDWPCGRQARDFLRDLVVKGETRCTSDRRDQYGRALAYCSIRDGDLGDAIVRAGYAIADLEYAVPLADARLNRRGIWAGSFIDPAEFRRTHDSASPSFWDWLLSLLPH